MCPVAAESKNSKPSSKKKINKKINTNLDTVVEEDSNKNSQNLLTSSGLNESSIENNNNEFSHSEEEDKGLGNIKLGPKGIYTEDSIRVYLQEIGRIRLLRPDELPVLLIGVSQQFFLQAQFLHLVLKAV